MTVQPLSLWKGDFARAPLNLRSILNATADKHGVLASDILGLARCRKIAHARQEFMWAAYQPMNKDGTHRFSLPKIGGFLGRDHTSVLHGVRAHAKRMATEAVAA